jgi:hypothetical protein
MNTTVQLPLQQQQPYHYDSKTGGSTRLSDEDDEHYTTDQFKMMTSKERRQIRNKLSARNFRNRRKGKEEQIKTRAPKNQVLY